MILEIEPLESRSTAKCHHRRCDGRSAKWRFPQTRDLPAGEILSCSVHIPHFCEIILDNYAIRSAVGGRTTVLVRRVASGTTSACRHPRCDGRSAKWRFPQTSGLVAGEHLSCSVHIARFCENVVTYHAVDVPVTIGRRPSRKHDVALSPGRTHVA